MDGIALMGTYRKTVAYRTDEETRQQHESIRTAFPWLLEDHTSVIKFCSRIVFALLFTAVTVEDVQDLLQGLRRITLQNKCDTAQYALPFASGVAVHFRSRAGMRA
jgi:hypothetical protein